MIEEQALERVIELRSQIDHYDYLYHTLDSPEISDGEYDKLLIELGQLESSFSHLLVSDSPTRKVGGRVLNTFEKVTHRIPMLSLSKAMNEQEFRAFDTRVRKSLPSIGLSPMMYSIEPKFDGLSVELIYEHGELVKALTRGDGIIGEDVTENVRTIQSIPQHLKGPAAFKPYFPELLEVRGEVYMEKKAFKELNRRQGKAGEALFANPRNAAAGSLRQQKSDIAASRPLMFFAYGVGDYKGLFRAVSEARTLQTLMMKLSNFGFRISSLTRYCLGIDEAVRIYDELLERRNSLPFEIDGAVAKIISLDHQEQLGTRSNSPRWAIAYKFPAQQATTVLKEIDIQVGRTGALTPVAYVEPVRIAGAMIQKATLHNEEDIQRKDLRVGDTVVIERSGDVIPKIISVVLSKRPKDAVPFVMPTRCPVCDFKAIKEEGEAVRKCSNPLCSAKFKESIKHYVSRNAMNIDGLGKRLVEKFVDEGLIIAFFDLYKLKVEDLAQLDKMGQSSARNVVDAIDKSRQTTLPRFLYALGIPLIGSRASKDVARHYKTIDALLDIQNHPKELVAEIGPARSNNIYKFFCDEQSILLVELLQDELTFEDVQTTSSVAQVFSGQRFVLTGSLESMSRDEAKEKIEALGGDFASSVSKKVNYVVIGDNAGSKKAKAEQLGITTLNEQEFLIMMEG